MLTDDQLREIEERCEKATRGPWETKLDPAYPSDQSLAVAPPLSASTGWIDVHTQRNFADLHNDAQFIAHAREDVPALLAEVRELQRDAALGRVVREALRMWSIDQPADIRNLWGAGLHQKRRPEGDVFRAIAAVLEEETHDDNA